MEIFISAVLGELTARSLSIFVSNYSKPSALDVEDHLRRVLQRAQVIVDEAMGRKITNRAMIKQLEMLREAIHRGCYTHDTFVYQSQDKEDAKDHIVSQSSSLSKINSIKDLCFFCGPRPHILEEMQEVLDRLNSMILEANELVLFLNRYPRLCHQPYSMHLLLGNYMFGRQMEIEVVISFLLHRQPHRANKELDVLPIVGPGRVGKSTLVAHVCNDERVRDHFSEVLLLSDQDFRDENLYVRREGRALEYQNCVLNKDGTSLVVVEIAGDLNEDAWKNFLQYKFSATSACKIIITSWSYKIKKFGTTGALTLKSRYSNEEYWYFFKTLAFGSTNPDTQPRLGYLAMRMARILHGSLVGANIAARLLRDNLDVQFWCKVLAYLKGLVQNCVAKFGEHPCDVLNESRAAHFGRMASASEEIIVHHQYQLSSQQEVPKIMFQDVMYGNIEPHGKFEALAWRSEIPPYHNIVYTCEIREIKTTGTKRKRSVVNGVTLG